ncbi:MAG: MOSC domain-containing protein [Bdellovibrionales bacterium]|nr:MOSC domain-containing protein [Bdellovibrionales bacterium]
MLAQIRHLFIYPLKSARGIELETMEIGPTGPRWDRQWMLIDSHNSFVSQRVLPELSQLITHLESDALTLEIDGQKLDVPLHGEGENITYRIFGKEESAESVSREIDQWFSEMFNKPLRLLKVSHRNQRSTSGNHGPKTPIGFADGYPFLLTNENSLDEFNKTRSTPVAMGSFRPNIVVGRAAAFAEESWEAFQIGDIPFLSVKPCTRCKVITIDQKTGEQDPSVLKDLKSFHSKDGQILFGQNLTHQGQGSIHRGDFLHST